jgi:ABC-type oligopeptide transport system ATPase subunit
VIPDGQPLLEASHLVKRFPESHRSLGRSRADVRAVNDVSLSVWPGETLGIVGESGCGKSTTARLMMRLIDPTGGRVHFRGQDITELSRRQMQPIRREMQMVFQNPYSSLNPRKTVHQIVSGPMRLHGATGDLRAQVRELLERVGLNPDYANRHPEEFSGGQRQRIGIARALGVKPSLIVCDEPVSALDVSIQAQVLALLSDLQQELGVSYVFISHDLAVIRQICDRVAVMYAGRIVEMGEVDAIFSDPRHPYTHELLAAVPGMRRRRQRRAAAAEAGGEAAVTMGAVEAAPAAVTTAGVEAAPAAGCPYQPRCPRSQDRCRTEVPALDDDPVPNVACHFPVTGGAAPE